MRILILSVTSPSDASSSLPPINTPHHTSATSATQCSAVSNASSQVNRCKRQRARPRTSQRMPALRHRRALAFSSRRASEARASYGCPRRAAACCTHTHARRSSTSDACYTRLGLVGGRGAGQSTRRTYSTVLTSRPLTALIPWFLEKLGRAV